MTAPVQTRMETTPYNAAFFDELESGSLRSARTVVPLVMALIRPSSVLDVGCGVGTWLKAFDENGVSDYLGIDGGYVSKEQMLIDSSHFRAVDLTNPQKLSRKFDLAVCLEVGEHLPARSALPLVQLLTSAAPYVLFSAALPGQGGTHHINEQWPQYWRRHFSRLGYERLDPLRPHIWRLPGVEAWYKTNMYLFCHNSMISSNSGLQTELEQARKCQFELIPTDILCSLDTTKGLTRALCRSALRTLRRMFTFHRRHS